MWQSAEDTVSCVYRLWGIQFHWLTKCSDFSPVVSLVSQRFFQTLKIDMCTTIYVRSQWRKVSFDLNHRKKATNTFFFFYIIHLHFISDVTFVFGTNHKKEEEERCPFAVFFFLLLFLVFFWFFSWWKKIVTLSFINCCLPQAIFL